MPLTMVKTGELQCVKKINGKDETKKFLEKLGVVIGGCVTVLYENGGNMIINVKGTRIAISKAMAIRIIV